MLAFSFGNCVSNTVFPFPLKKNTRSIPNCWPFPLAIVFPTLCSHYKEHSKSFAFSFGNCFSNTVFPFPFLKKNTRSIPNPFANFFGTFGSTLCSFQILLPFYGNFISNPPPIPILLALMPHFHFKLHGPEGFVPHSGNPPPRSPDHLFNHRDSSPHRERCAGLVAPDKRVVSLVFPDDQNPVSSSPCR